MVETYHQSGLCIRGRQSSAWSCPRVPLGEGIQARLDLGRVRAIGLVIVISVSAYLVMARSFVNNSAVFKINLATQRLGVICA